MNIGKKVKLNTNKGKKPNTAFAVVEDRNFSSVSFLQDVRNISKTSSIKPNSKSLGMHNKITSGFKNPNRNPSILRMYDKIGSGGSLVSEKFGQGHFTRNKTKVFNLDGNTKFGREESDPAYRQSVFNEGNSFQTADHYFGLHNPSHPFDNFQPSNPFNIVKEISVTKGKNPSQSIMPRLKHENFQGSRNLNVENSFPYMNMSNNTASFGQINLRSGRRVSQPIQIKSKSTATKILKREKDISLPINSQIRTRSSALRMKN